MNTATTSDAVMCDSLFEFILAIVDTIIIYELYMADKNLSTYGRLYFDHIF